MNLDIPKKKYVIPTSERSVFTKTQASAPVFTPFFPMKFACVKTSAPQSVRKTPHRSSDLNTKQTRGHTHRLPFHLTVHILHDLAPADIALLVRRVHRVPLDLAPVVDHVVGAPHHQRAGVPVHARLAAERRGVARRRRRRPAAAVAPDDVLARGPALQARQRVAQPDGGLLGRRFARVAGAGELAAGGGGADEGGGEGEEGGGGGGGGLHRYGGVGLVREQGPWLVGWWLVLPDWEFAGSEEERGTKGVWDFVLVVLGPVG